MLQSLFRPKKEDICPNCGTACLASDLYCPKCGSNLDELYEQLPDDWSADQLYEQLPDDWTAEGKVPPLGTDSRLFLAWVGVTALALSIMPMFRHGLYFGLPDQLFWPAVQAQTDLLIALLLSLGLGMSLGALQWLTLRSWFLNSQRWIWLTLLGVMAGNALGRAIDALATPLLPRDVPTNMWELYAWVVLMAGGAAIGLSQWLVLRKNLQSSWHWIAATVIAWPLAASVQDSLLRTLCYPIGILGFPQYAPDVPCETVVGGVQGAVLGIVTGAALIWLLRRNGFRPPMTEGRQGSESPNVTTL